MHFVPNVLVAAHGAMILYCIYLYYVELWMYHINVHHKGRVRCTTHVFRQFVHFLYIFSNPKFKFKNGFFSSLSLLLFKLIFVSNFSYDLRVAEYKNKQRHFKITPRIVLHRIHFFPLFVWVQNFLIHPKKRRKKLWKNY